MADDRPLGPWETAFGFVGAGGLLNLFDPSGVFWDTIQGALVAGFVIALGWALRISFKERRQRQRGTSLESDR